MVSGKHAPKGKPPDSTKREPSSKSAVGLAAAVAATLPTLKWLMSPAVRGCELYRVERPVERASKGGPGTVASERRLLATFKRPADLSDKP